MTPFLVQERSRYPQKPFAPEDAMEAGTEIGSYIIDKPLGEGGMAQVYLAHHAHLGSKHAIKVLLPELLRDEELRLRFLGEGRIQAQLRHPNIVPVTDVVSVPGVAGLVMDFVDGITLEDFIQQNPKPTVETIRHLFLQILDAIGFAHENGVVHRDIKPSNVLVSKARDGSLVAQVLDFGIAKVFENEGRAATRTGMRMGTPQYMSPEQIRGLKDVDHRSDIFSLGALLYEMASGEVAFDGASEFDIQTAIVNGKYRSLEGLRGEVKGAFATAIRRALEVERGERFQSCGEFGEALAERKRLVQEPQKGHENRFEQTQGSADQTLREARALLASDPKQVEGPEKPEARPKPDARVLSTEYQTITRNDLPKETLGRTAGPSTIWALTGVVAFVVLGGIWVFGGSGSGKSTKQSQQVASSGSAPEPSTGTDPEMVQIPAGSFRMGSTDGRSDEKPVTQVSLSSYEIDKTQVTVGAYRQCVNAGKCSAANSGGSCNWGQSNKENHPVNCVNWHQAKAFCEWRGARLPSEAEWEYAARGSDGRIYPWGNQEPGNRACWNRWSNRLGTCAVGSYPSGRSPFGLEDMAGNVWEWVGDWYKDSYPGGSVRNPHGPSSGSYRVLRGGAWNSIISVWLRAGVRDWSPAVSRLSDFGFRCARGAVFD